MLLSERSTALDCFLRESKTFSAKSCGLLLSVIIMSPSNEFAQQIRF